MKILFHFRTQGSGAEGVHISGVARAFRRLGHAVTFCSPSGIDPTKTAGTNPFGGARKGFLARLAAHAPKLLFELIEIGYNGIAALRIGALLRGERFDLIYERHAFFLCAAALLANRQHVPLVVEVNELAGDERVRAQPFLLPLARFADRITFRRARLIVVVSPHLQRRIEAMGIAPEKILVLPNAVDEEAPSTDTDGTMIRGHFQYEGALVIGFAGWFVPWHRLDLLLKVFASLAATAPELRLLLVGDGPLRSTLKAQATDLGVLDRVIFTGAVSHEEMPHHLAAMDVCVIPHSNSYRSPIKLFEYMAGGRAVVAPRTEPIGLVLRHGENGLLFAPENEDDLRGQLSALIRDRQLRSRLGHQARLDISQKHTWSQNARQVLTQLLSLGAR